MRILRAAIAVFAAALVALAIFVSVYDVRSASATPSDKPIGWGLGPQRDEQNRPVDAVRAQQKYEQYDAHFLLERGICFTFDLGYENGYTPVILDALKAENVKAVFFVTLDYVKEAPDVVSRIIAEGHILANHTAKHKQLPRISEADATTDVMTLHDYVLENFGVAMDWFRFPEGLYSEKTLQFIQQLGYKTMFWGYAYVDWLTDKQPDPTKAMDKALAAAHEGAIYLFHAVSSTNAEIMGPLIRELKARGYSFILPNEQSLILPDRITDERSSA